MTKNKNNKSMIETLESRTMCAGHALKAASPIALTVTTNGSDLVINGSAAADQITVTKTDAGLVIGNTGGWTTTVSGNYSNIRIYGNAGNDTVTVDASVTNNAMIYGGAGNDTLVGGNGNDTFVTIGGGKDTVTGRVGNDSIWADKTDVITDASAFENSNGYVHKVAAFQGVKTTTVSGKTTKVTITKVSSELNGDNLVDPTAGAGLVYRNFSTKPLFADNGPVANDVQQGYLGDCYFLATLSSTAKADANLIKQSVVELGDGTYAVKFVKNGAEMYFRVDGQLPTWGNGALAYANTGTQNSVWVAIMEKAYAMFRTGANTYASIESGWMSEVYSALGKSSTSMFSTSSAASLLNVIKTALEQGKSVTYGTTTPTDGAPLIGGHAYMVDHVNADAQGNLVSVTLRNPWGIDGAGNDGANDGYVTITAAQAKNAFIGLAIAAV